ncbi:MAG TPA: AbrB/MazE/SpoVT family DNA-binding domain-containing protein [Aggregatilineaceae bacterium]|nr:AbrB/MazE/SpoVT family DNA-binding domain-containing protein [Aggregatilineaceae bacterium]
MRRIYTIQENGQVTLPVDWREKYGLKKGDVVSFIETDQGLLVVPREVMALEALDRIGQALKERGITLDEMIESGREIRQDLYNEKHADQDA